jgi:hypothetical protein
MEARVTLRPGAKGTKALTAEFGDRLICVRYRYDITGKRRLKTVEIIVDEGPWEPTPRQSNIEPERERPQEIVGVRVAFAEEALRRTVREAGGHWDRQMSLWLMSISTVRLLGLEERIIRVLPLDQGGTQFRRFIDKPTDRKP